MILDSITLNNFGLYAGRQTVELTPPSIERPIVLFGGMNGGGKTTFMDALQLCFFGAHAKTSSRGSTAYGDYLSSSIHRRAAPPESSIEIRFRHMADGSEDQFKLERSWSRLNGKCTETFVVEKNGQLEDVVAQNWSSQVDEFMPANIAHLFLFDGEQIERYASTNESCSLVEAGVLALLGLDMVDQLDQDLRVYERRKRTEDQNEATRVAINAVERDMRTLRHRVEDLNQERAALLTYQIDRQRRKLVECETRYKSLGGLLFEQRSEIERDLNAAQTFVDEAATSLRELAAGSLPMLLTRKLLDSVAERDQQEEDARRARELLAILTARDKETLRRLRVESVDEDMIRALETHLEADREGRRVIGQQQPELNVHPSVRNDLKALLENVLAQLMVLAKKQLATQQEALRKLVDAKCAYDSVPDSDAIAGIIDEREAARKKLASLEVQHTGIGGEIKRLEQEFERKEQLLMRLIHDDAAENNKWDDRKRILRHIDRVRSTLSDFRRIVVMRHVNRIERLVLESYQQLLRKESLVARLTIDPDTFAITIFANDGRPLNPERLSAGERQLLGVSLLWGLARASGRPLPTAIDTPLGRLDTTHRMNLIERYFPFASHQMLLFSTDEEITGEYLNRLRPWIGRSYTLSYSDKAEFTQIVPGYFERKEIE